MNRFYTIICSCLLVAGCNVSKDKRIIGAWEVISKAPTDSKTIIQFNADKTMQLEVRKADQIISSNSGTYSIDKDEKRLIIYREGKTDRKNIAGIIELTKTQLTLTDISGFGDTMHLSKRD